MNEKANAVIDQGAGFKARRAEEHISAGAISDVEVAKELQRRVGRLNDATIDIAVRAAEARELLDWHCNNVRDSWMTWLEESSRVMESIRQTRVAIGQESRMLLAELGDVRKFFLGADHEVEVAKLREFIELAERLRELKRDGTLDRLADTILKLA